MSNVLCPIVARYSLFFTLALFDSSTLALSKQPREDALDMVQRAQAQFQAHHRQSHATKLRALIRNVSTASSSSTSSSSSSSTYSSSHQSQSSASTAPSSTSSTVLLSSFPKDAGALSTETVTQFDVTSPQPSTQVKRTSTTSPTSTSSPSSLAPIPSSSTLYLSSPSPTSSPTTHPARKTSIKKTRTRRASKPSAAITTLLSISITIILLSLLQSRSRYQLVRQKSIVTQGSHNDRQRSHRRRRHHYQQHTPKQHRSVSTENPSSPLAQLCEHRYKGDSATSVPDSVHKVKNTSTSIKAIAPVNSSFSSSSTLIVFTSTTTTPITTTTMATLAHSTSTPNPTSSKQLRNEFVTAWLQRQIIDPTIDSAIDCDDHLDTNQIEDYHVSDYHVSDQHRLHPGTITSYNSYHHLLQANHSTALTSRTTLVQGHGHRRCLSLMNPSTSPVTPTKTINYDEQLQQQLEWHHQNYQHLHTTIATTTVIPQYPEYPVHPYIEEHTPYWPPQRTAEELAWERHNYYLRLQAEEEELIERLQSNRKQNRGHRTQNKTLNHLWQPRPDTSSVARTGSLNRLSGPSLLSAETSRVLGLCRSSTLSAVKKIGFAKKDTTSRSSRSTSPLPVSSNTNAIQSNIDDDSILTQGLAIHSYERITTTASNMTAATASSSTLFSFSPKSSTLSAMGASSPPPKNLLKDHLGPSLKSLARRCSTRFGRSSRSNSYAGPSGAAVVEYPHGRRSLGSHPSQKQRGHLYDFKQLPTGPTGGSTEISKSSRPQEGRHRRSLSSERIPVHRTVTLSRSKSTRAPSSTPMVKKHDDHPSPIMTVLDLPYRPHRNSLRFANGRGLDFSNTPNLTTASSSSNHSNRSSVDFKRNAMSSSSLPSVVEDKEMVPMITTSLVDNLESPSAVIVSSLVPTSVLDLEEHETMRQQIVAILSLDRNDMRRRPSSKPRSRSTTPRIPQDHSTSQQEDPSQQQQQQQQQQLEYLSPLAMEAQEVLPEDPKTIQEQEVAAELADPCEYIAFMLVPKTQYEFQPLIAH